MHIYLVEAKDLPDYATRLSSDASGKAREFRDMELDSFIFKVELCKVTRQELAIAIINGRVANYIQSKTLIRTVKGRKRGRA